MDRSLRRLLADITAGRAARGLRAKDTKVGCACLKVITMPGSPGDHRSARSATAARRHHGGSRIHDKIRRIVADLITGGAVPE